MRRPSSIASTPSRAMSSASPHSMPGGEGITASTPEASMASVRVGPGENAVHETPDPISSAWIASESVRTNAFDAE